MMNKPLLQFKTYLCLYGPFIYPSIRDSSRLFHVSAIHLLW